MEYVIIILLVISIILNILVLLRRNKDAEMTERLGRFEVNINKELISF